MTTHDPGLDGLTRLGLVSQEAKVELLSQISTWAEGPLWIPESQTVRWSDIKGNRILQWSWATGETSVYSFPAEFTNGRTLDLDGSVVQCSHGHRRVERDRDGVVTPIVDSWQGRRLNSPNDIVVTRDGAIWFTDPDYGITEPLEGHPGELEYGDHWVFRVDSAAATPETDPVPIVLDAERPNGLAFSPDESVLYVADSGVTAQRIVAYDVTLASGAGTGTGTDAGTSTGAGAGAYSVGAPRLFATPRPGTPDGIRVDVAGNVWSSCGSGVKVYDPEGTLLGSIDVPEVTANLCFGGPDGTTLFMTATTGLYRIPTLTRDAHQRY
jgi:gluconolactonase